MLKCKKFPAIAHFEATPSFAWCAAVHSTERKKSLAELPPQFCCVAAEPVEREIEQIGETQEAACKIHGMVDIRIDGFSAPS